VKLPFVLSLRAYRHPRSKGNGEGCVMRGDTGAVV
jgi:hypothetical protein